MSANQMHYHFSRKAAIKPPMSVSNVTQNIGHNNSRSLAPAPKRMSKDSGNDGFYQPPDKRRKTEEAKVDNSEEWDDGDFTEDQLENIDEIVMLSQQVPQGRAVDGNHNNKKVSTAPVSSRALGKGINRSQSAGDVHSPTQGLPPTYPTNKPLNQGFTQQQRKPAATGVILSEKPLDLCYTTGIWFH